MREESQRLSKAEKTITKDETQEDTTIKKLDEERKALRNIDVKSDREKIQYAELNITVKKMRRTRARRKKKEHVEKILASGRGPKEALRGNGRKVIGELRTENSKIVTKNEDILINVCAKFYQELYSSNSDQSSAIGPHTQNNEKIPLFVEDEMRNALKSMIHYEGKQSTRKRPNNKRRHQIRGDPSNKTTKNNIQ